ncbi:MAG: gliding motility-associated C-terminal domain-containing protein, partial [Bacteroidia bacterium]|nr:gliding motility-associated C-terminal domain-containing protein [Bacteroidia bacterium]
QGQFAIPNVFTPNGDGVNEQWKFELPYGVTLISLEIYDRWGRMVFERKGEVFPDTRFLIWDGYSTSALPCDEGTYLYILQTNNENQGPKENRGMITLSR